MIIQRNIGFKDLKCSKFRAFLMAMIVCALFYFWNYTFRQQTELPIIHVTPEQVVEFYKKDNSITAYAFTKGYSGSEGDVFYIIRENEVTCMRIVAVEEDRPYAFSEVRKFTDLTLPTTRFDFVNP